MVYRHQVRLAGAAVLGLCLALPSLGLAQSAAGRLPGVIDRPVPVVPLPPGAGAAAAARAARRRRNRCPMPMRPVPTIKQVVFSGLGRDVECAICSRWWRPI